MDQPRVPRFYYYSSAGQRIGPVTAQQLRDLAAKGLLALTDTVWVGDSEKGIPASKVKRLFPEAQPIQVILPKPADAPPDRPRPDPVHSRDAFISYSSHDKPTADAICAALERDKVRCWIAPRDVLPGVNYGEAIIDGINSCRLLVIVLSSASNGSPQVLREVERAVSKGIPIIPFRIEDVVPSKSMEYFLSAPHWLDALTKPLEAHIERLSTVARAVLSPDQQGPSGGRRASSPQYGAVNRASGPLIGTLLSPFRWSGRIWTSVPRSLRLAGLGLALLTLLVIAAVVYLTPNPLTKEYAEYRHNLVTGRGSIAYLEKAAPLRYADWHARAESGNPIAQLFIGRCYQEGLVVNKDPTAAIPWIQKSAAQGNDFAMDNLGWASEHGLGVPADSSKALQWYTRGAASGNTVSMLGIGGLYASGGLGKTDPELALSWYRKAADAGDPVAMRLVGNCYYYGTGATTDVAEGERWYRKAAKAGDAFQVGKDFGNKLAPFFAAYLAADAKEAKKASALASLRDLKGEYERLDFACLAALYSASDLGSATTGLDDLKPDEPLRVLHDELTQKYMTAYTAAAQSERLSNISSFSLATESLVKRWFTDREYDKVAEFWEHSYKGVPASDIKSDNEINGLIRQLNWSVCSLMRTGKRKEADEVLHTALELCDRTLQDHPWDWYLKDAYSGLCFDAASTWVELGEPANAQPLLKRGWGVLLKQAGKEALLSKYSELPLKGKAPAGAADADREFFEKFASGADKKKSGMKRFTIPCDFAGKKYPFFVYVMSGPRGYAELQDQFRWLKEFRGGEVPPEVRASFLRLNQIAVENNVDFMELCVYALGMDSKEKAGENKKDKSKN